MDLTEIIVAIVVSVLGGGGLLQNWLTSRRNKKLTTDESILKRFESLEKQHAQDQAHNLAKLKADYERLDKLEKIAQRTSEGVILGLKNDEVMFDYFKTNHINGNSEKQLEEMRNYYHKCVEDTLNKND